jgi:3,4-dihydroxy-2-butanone 4-phosphate synthase
MLLGCATSTPQKPAWIDNPGNGVSASAGTHVRGRVAQEELAISRARTEYAKRFGVSIDSGQIIQTSVSNDRANTVGESVAVEKSSQTDVKAMVKAKWFDEDNDVIWVWLVPSN